MRARTLALFPILLAAPGCFLLAMDVRDPHLTFGNVFVGDHTASQRGSWENAEDREVTVTEIEVLGDEDDFRIRYRNPFGGGLFFVDSPPWHVGRRDSFQTDIAFAPKSPGDKTVLVRPLSDGEEHQYLVAVGRGILLRREARYVRLDGERVERIARDIRNGRPHALLFGEIPVGTSSLRTVLVTNRSPGPIRARARMRGTDFVAFELLPDELLAQRFVDVAPGASEPIEIVFRPYPWQHDERREYVAALEVQSVDPAPLKQVPPLLPARAGLTCFGVGLKAKEDGGGVVPEEEEREDRDEVPPEEGWKRER